MGLNYLQLQAMKNAPKNCIFISRSFVYNIGNPCPSLESMYLNIYLVRVEVVVMSDISIKCNWAAPSRTAGSSIPKDRT